jgi:hypothetical protein
MNYYENIIFAKLINGIYNANDRAKILAHLDPKFIREAKQLIRDAKAKVGLDDEGLKYRKMKGKEAYKFKQKTGFDVKKYDRKITKSDVRHLHKEHGNPKTEKPRGQIAVTTKDVLLIPHITRYYDKLTLQKDKAENKPVVEYVKTLDKKKYHYLETIGSPKGARDLKPKTMFKKK